MKPYYQDEWATLYNCDWREQTAETRGDLILTDPPYGETPLPWDRWPDDWPGEALQVASAMWCFGSMRMFTAHWIEFASWRFSHEVVWQKPNATGLARDKFRRVHEFATFWYQGKWANVHHEVPRVPSGKPLYERPFRKLSSTVSQTFGRIPTGTWTDDGTRYQSTIIPARNEHRRGVHPTQKPIPLLTPLVMYGVAEGGTVVDLFAGSCSVAVAARRVGRKSVSFEVDEAYCEAAAKRLEAEAATLEVGAW